MPAYYRLTFWIALVSALAGNPICSAQAAPDFTQAEAMLNVLRTCRDKGSGADIDHVLTLPGTELVVAQQNISRRVTMQQYRDVLRAACSGKVAQIRPAEPGARAEKGVAGLTEDVAPSLIWGRDHVAQLESKLRELQQNNKIGDAVPLARKYLPSSVSLNPKLYVVMGGRAGAAAIDDGLYFDVLISEWRSSMGHAAPVGPSDVVLFFAHETHHLGYGQILDEKRASLHMNPAEDQAWRFLTSILMEGSATLLINGQEQLSVLETQSDVKAYLDKAPDLLPAMQKILNAALNGPMSAESYDEAVDPFLNMGYHAAGAVLLAAIEKKQGFTGVMQVMADPRRLLETYNACASDSNVSFRFDPTLAARIAKMGSN